MNYPFDANFKVKLVASLLHFSPLFSVGLATSVVQDFGYDSLNHLISSSSASYNYVDAGNLLTIIGAPPTKPHGPTLGVGMTGIGKLPMLGWTAAQNAKGLTHFSSTNSNLFGAIMVQIDH